MGVDSTYQATHQPLERRSSSCREVGVQVCLLYPRALVLGSRLSSKSDGRSEMGTAAFYFRSVRIYCTGLLCARQSRQSFWRDKICVGHIVGFEEHWSGSPTRRWSTTSTYFLQVKAWKLRSEREAQTNPFACRVSTVVHHGAWREGGKRIQFEENNRENGHFQFLFARRKQQQQQAGDVGVLRV